jgi:hypothetical protein
MGDAGYLGTILNVVNEFNFGLYKHDIFQNTGAPCRYPQTTRNSCLCVAVHTGTHNKQKLTEGQ